MNLTKNSFSTRVHSFKIKLTQHFSVRLVVLVFTLTFLLLLTPIKLEIIPHFLGLHTALEAFCIVVSLMIFVTLFVLRDCSTNQLYKVFGIPFLGVAIFDLLHTFSYEGLPNLVTENSPQKSICFWLAARFLEAIAFSFFVLSVRKKRVFKFHPAIIYAIVFILIAVVTYSVLFFPDSVPSFIDEHSRINSLKISLELLLLVLHLSLGFLLLYSKGNSTNTARNYYLTTASFVLVASGLCFITFIKFHDSVIFWGHLLKVVAYFCIFRACLQTELLEPYLQLVQLNQELLKQNEQIRMIRNHLSRLERLSIVGLNVSSIVHDLNNMLAVADFTARKILQLATERESTANIKAYSEKLIQSLDKSQGLQKLILSQAHSTPVEESIIHFDIVFDSFVPFLKVLAGKSNSFVTDIDRNLPVRGSQLGLEQILMNLVVNARDAMTDKPGELCISAKNVDVTEPLQTIDGFIPSGKYLMIAVKDQGTGIQPEIVKKVFEPLFTTKDSSKGTGLGLSTVLEIVKKWNGFISLHTEVNRGTEFRIYFSVPT